MTTLNGDKGSDQEEGGGGNDKLSGEKGNDEIEGGPGSDQIDGGPGDDPKLDGGPDSDFVFGGAGSDNASGGGGDGDVVRGDSGEDTLDGGPGVMDIVSYASATRSGVIVDLSSGRSKGDGHDTLSGFEDVVGSPQGDDIVGDAGTNRLDGGVGNDDLNGDGGADEAFGGAGSDQCDGFAMEHSCGTEENPPGNGTFVILNQGLDGSSLIVQGDSRANDIHVFFNNGIWTVSENGPIVAGEGCQSDGSSSLIATVSCPTSVATSLLVITGGDGDDSINVSESVPGQSKSEPTATLARTRSAAVRATTCWKRARTTTARTTATTP